MIDTPHLHSSDDPEHVRAPAVTYASVLGSGAPGTEAFYRRKRIVGGLARHLDNTAEPVIEIQYWYPAGSNPVEIADFYSVNPIPSLLYRVLARVPDDTTADDLVQAHAHVATGSDQDGDVVELHTTPAQDVVQVMHHGPFAEEYATLERLGTFARNMGVRRDGPHHEIHLDGFTHQTPQDTLRTILRDPVA